MGMNCKDGTFSMAAQIFELLNLLDNQGYAASLDVFHGSSLGQHFRHILDFYKSIIKGNHLGHIDYSDRERSTQVEIDIAYAKNAIDHVIKAIKDLDEQKPILVKADFSHHVKEDRPMVESSIGRELMFAYDHALHHLAMIMIGIRTSLPGIQINEALGVAPATLKYRNDKITPK